MRAYSCPGLSKAEFLAELQMHVEADRLVHGTYFENGDGWRGCAVGCSLESVRRRLKFAAYDSGWHGRHAEYERYLGIPEILARLEDSIFEALPIDEAKQWPLRFSAAIQEGADLSRVWSQFAPWPLREIALPAVAVDERAVRSAIQRVIAGYENGWQNDSASAAASAAADVAATVDASAYTAYTAYAVYAAADTASAVYAPAYAASAVASAANASGGGRFDAWRKMAAKLCELMAEVPATDQVP